MLNEKNGYLFEGQTYYIPKEEPKVEPSNINEPEKDSSIDEKQEDVRS